MSHLQSPGIQKGLERRHHSAYQQVVDTLRRSGGGAERYHLRDHGLASDASNAKESNASFYSLVYAIDLLTAAITVV